MDNNPNLVTLRMLQTLSETSGNTIVFNAGPQNQIIPVKGPPAGESETSTDLTDKQ